VIGPCHLSLRLCGQHLIRDWEVTKLLDANDNTYKHNIGCQWCVYDLLRTIIVCTEAVSMWLRCASTECQQLLVLHIRQSMGAIVTYCQRECIGGRYSRKGKWHARCHILKMSIKGKWMECQRCLPLHLGISIGLRGQINSESNYPPPF